MDQDHQELKHVCRFCNKSFSNGKVLGGHMRCHVAKNPKKLSKKRSEALKVHTKSYGLRVNPKKSSRISPASSDQETPLRRKIPCRDCDKAFRSMRALFGHMRHHSASAKPKREGLIVEKLFVEASGFAKRKRSTRSRYKVSTSSSSPEFDKDLEEIAACLLMLSTGFEKPHESDDRDDEFRTVTKKPRIDKDPGFELDSLGNKTPSRFSENDETLNDQHCGQLSWSETTATRIEYKCKTCDKIFNTHQALGGHQTIHRTSRACFESQSDGFEEFMEFEAERANVVVTSSETTSSSNTNNNKEHKCHICFKVFGSGQALGGHKRAHMVKESEVEADQIIALVDHGLGCDVELKSPWWVGDNTKHELLMSLVPS